MSHGNIDQVWGAASADRPATWRDLAMRPLATGSPVADGGPEGKRQPAAFPVAQHVRRIVSKSLKLLTGW